MSRARVSAVFLPPNRSTAVARELLIFPNYSEVTVQRCKDSEYF